MVRYKHNDNFSSVYIIYIYLYIFIYYVHRTKIVIMLVSNHSFCKNCTSYWLCRIYIYTHTHTHRHVFVYIFVMLIYETAVISLWRYVLLSLHRASLSLFISYPSKLQAWTIIYNLLFTSKGDIFFFFSLLWLLLIANWR